MWTVRFLSISKGLWPCGWHRMGNTIILHRSVLHVQHDLTKDKLADMEQTLSKTCLMLMERKTSVDSPLGEYEPFMLKWCQLYIAYRQLGPNVNCYVNYFSGKLSNRWHGSPIVLFQLSRCCRILPFHSSLLLCIVHMNQPYDAIAVFCISSSWWLDPSVSFVLYNCFASCCYLHSYFLLLCTFY
jgi:hypothetical protein